MVPVSSEGEISSRDIPHPAKAVSRPSKETNSVKGSLSGKQEEAEDKLLDRVTEFHTEYPELADLSLCETDGRKLRRFLAEAEYETAWVEPEEPTEDAFAVEELHRRTAATWGDAVHAFLRSHVDYMGLAARFADGEGDEFDVPLVDAWGEEYSRKQYARARALQRQMCGGERPSGGEAVAAWTDPATAMLTFTASSVPDGRLAPVDHLDAVHDAFSYGGVRDALRNTMEYHLGLEPDSWGYWLQAEPHGMGAADDDNEEPGLNACYTHIHVGVYFDAATAPELHSVGTELERVIDKHVSECEYATFGAHDYTAIDDYVEEDDGCISLNADVGNLGSYMAAYMGGYTEDLLDKPIEYIAWGAIYWATARRRTSRSKIVNESIRADRCHQRSESEQSDQSASHGEEVRWNDGRGPDVVCSRCGSGWAIPQDLLDEPTPDDELREALADGGEAEGEEIPDPSNLARRWPSADAAAAVGESSQRARIREKVVQYLDINGGDPNVPEMLAHLNINPRHREFVQEIVDGATDPPEDAFERVRPPGSDYELKSIVESDGTEHPPGGGGVDMAELELPVKRILENTRLQYDLKSGEKWRCTKCNVSVHNHDWMARHLVDEGATTPQQAEYLLKIEDYYDNEREVMEKEVESVG